MLVSFGTGRVGIGADRGGVTLYEVPPGEVGRVIPGPATDTPLVRLEFATADSLDAFLRVLAAVRDGMKRETAHDGELAAGVETGVRTDPADGGADGPRGSAADG